MVRNFLPLSLLKYSSKAFLIFKYAEKGSGKPYTYLPICDIQPQDNGGKRPMPRRPRIEIVEKSFKSGHKCHQREKFDSKKLEMDLIKAKKLEERVILP